MTTGTIYPRHQRTCSQLMERVLGRRNPKPRHELPIAAPAGPHHSTSQSERSIPRRRAATQMGGWTLLTLLCGGLALATFVFRQDISLMITLHQLRSLYGTPNIYRIEYCDDGWTEVQKIEPYELIYHTRSEEDTALPAPGALFDPMWRDGVASIPEAAGLGVAQAPRIAPAAPGPDAAFPGSLINDKYRLSEPE